MGVTLNDRKREDGQDSDDEEKIDEDGATVLECACLNLRICAHAEYYSNIIKLNHGSFPTTNLRLTITLPFLPSTSRTADMTVQKQSRFATAPLTTISHSTTGKQKKKPHSRVTTGRLLNRIRVPLKFWIY